MWRAAGKGKNTNLTGAYKGLVDAKEALAFQLDDCAVLHVAQGRFASGKRALAAVGVDEVFDVFTLETQYMNERKARVKKGQELLGG